MPATQTPDVSNRLADLTCPELLKPSYIESGRRYWEASSASALIRMFAVAGYDVVSPEAVEDENRDSRERIVRDQSGHEVATILWCKSVPAYADARTPRVW
jgi:hypothetical protein